MLVTSVKMLCEVTDRHESHRSKSCVCSPSCSSCRITCFLFFSCFCLKLLSIRASLNDTQWACYCVLINKVTSDVGMLFRAALGETGTYRSQSENMSRIMMAASLHLFHDATPPSVQSPFLWHVLKMSSFCLDLLEDQELRKRPMSAFHTLKSPWPPPFLCFGSAFRRLIRRLRSIFYTCVL